MDFDIWEDDPEVEANNESIATAYRMNAAELFLEEETQKAKLTRGFPEVSFREAMRLRDLCCVNFNTWKSAKFTPVYDKSPLFAMYLIFSKHLHRAKRIVFQTEATCLRPYLVWPVPPQKMTQCELYESVLWIAQMWDKRRPTPEQSKGFLDYLLLLEWRLADLYCKKIETPDLDGGMEWVDGVRPSWFFFMDTANMLMYFEHDMWVEREMGSLRQITFAETADITGGGYVFGEVKQRLQLYVSGLMNDYDKAHIARTALSDYFTTIIAPVGEDMRYSLRHSGTIPSGASAYLQEGFNSATQSYQTDMLGKNDCVLHDWGSVRLKNLMVLHRFHLLCEGSDFDFANLAFLRLTEPHTIAAWPTVVISPPLVGVLYKDVRGRETLARFTCAYDALTFWLMCVARTGFVIECDGIKYSLAPAKETLKLVKSQKRRH